MARRNSRGEVRIRPVDREFMADARAALLNQSTPGTLLVLWLILTVLVAGGVWASLAQVEEIVKAEGKVIPAGREQVIQSLDGGILGALNVHEGEIVEKGQVLLRLDATQARSAWQETSSKVAGLEGSVARLHAEAYATALVFPESLKAWPSIIRDETKAYQARKKAVDDGVAVLRRSLQLSEKEIGMSAPLVAQGLMSEVELLRMRRQANDLRLQITERQNRYRSEANAELVKLESELAQTKKNTQAKEDLFQRTTLVAPTRGVVKNIRLTTPGGVIPQGTDIMSLIPLEDELIVEAKVRPEDVAFLHPGLPVTVKLTAYDYAIYGGLAGTLTYISADTLEENPRGGAQKETTYYRIRVHAKRSVLTAGGQDHPIIPGMTAAVEIKTGKKTILSYLLKPVLKSREAFRER